MNKLVSINYNMRSSMIRCHTRCLLWGLFSVFCILGFSANAFSQQFDFRAINLVQGSSGIDVHFNDLAQASLSNIQFGDASKVLPGLPAVGGEFNVKIAASGDGVGSAFVGETVTVQSGYEYTAVAYGSDGAEKLNVLERSNQQPVNGKVLVRVLHAVNDAAEFDVYVGSVTGPALFTNVKQDEASKALSITAEAAALIITQAGSKVPLVQLTGPFGLGTPYLTLIMTGDSKDDLQVYAHAYTGREEQGAELIRLEEASYANLRVVHLRPNQGSKDGDKLDIYFNRTSQTDTKVTDTLKYRYTSRDFGPLFANTFRLKFVPGGESPTTTVLTLDQELGNDTSYVVILTQFQDLKPTPFVLRRSPVNPIPPGLGSSQIRFANAAPFHTPVTIVLKYGTDTMRFENVGFKNVTEFRDIPTGAPLELEAYMAGSSEPFFATGVSPLQVPVGAYLTIISSGNQGDFSVDLLNESLSGLQRLFSFDPATSVPVEDQTDRYQLTSIPNPASDRALLSFQLERPGRVDIQLYDGLGRAVGEVASGNFEAGPAGVEIDTQFLVPGTYTCVLHNEDGTIGTARVVIVR